MSEVFYEIAASKGGRPEFVNLMETLRDRACRYTQRQRDFADRIRANREAREGRPIKLTKAQRRTIDNFERDGQRAGEELRARLQPEEQSEAWWIQLAVDFEQSDLDFDEQMLDGYHEDDRALAREMIDMKRENIRILQAFRDVP